MKKQIAITISCALTAAVLLGSGGVTAFADQAGAGASTFYPETFEAGIITDYAVNGENFAFATDKKIAVYGGEVPVYYEFGVEITALDYDEDKEGFCYKTAGGIVYDMEGNTLTREIKPTELPVTPVGSGYSFTLQDGDIKIWDGTEYIIEGDFSNLKVFDNIVYAMNGNVLNKITPPATAEPINYEVADFSSSFKIAIGNTVEALNTYNLDKPHFTVLDNGEYLTEVKLDAENFDKTKVKAEDFFKVGRTFKVGEEKGFTANMSAAVLCKTGNAHIIALGGKHYLKLAKTAVAREFTEPEFVSAQINVPADYIYSSPNLCDAAKLRQVSWGESVKVLGKLLKSTSPEIPCDFYKIALTDAEGNILKSENGAEVIGYAPCSFVFEKKETNNDDKTEDPAPSTENNIKTVILVLIVVVLVLVALGYITFVFTSDKKRKKK